MNDIDISSPEDLAEHLSVLKTHIQRTEDRKKMNLDNVEEKRKQIITEFLQGLTQKGFDVSTPEKFMQYLAEVSKVDPDKATIILNALEDLLPDDDEKMFLATYGKPRVKMYGPDEALPVMGSPEMSSGPEATSAEPPQTL